MSLTNLTRNNLSANIEVREYKYRLERARTEAEKALCECLRTSHTLQVKYGELDKAGKSLHNIERSIQAADRQAKFYAGVVNGYNGALKLLETD
jgi:hypothetical protein